MACVQARGCSRTGAYSRLSEGPPIFLGGDVWALAEPVTRTEPRRRAPISRGDVRHRHRLQRRHLHASTKGPNFSGATGGSSTRHTHVFGRLNEGPPISRGRQGAEKPQSDKQ